MQRELAEALEREAATGEILRMIARSAGELQKVMDAIAEKAARLCDADDALVRRLEGDRYYSVSHFGSIPTATALGADSLLDRSTPAGRAVVDRKTIHVPDLRAAAKEFPGARIRGLTVGVRTALAAPLLRDGQAIGSIHIRRTRVRPFTDTQIKLLETFADQAVIAIENARLFQERETRNRDLAALQDVTAAASQSLDIKPVLDEVVKKITEIFHFDGVRIFIYDPRSELLNLMALHGLPDVVSSRAFLRGQGNTGWVAETGRCLIFEDTRTDPRYAQLSQTRRNQQSGSHFLALFPIKSKENFLGTVNCVGIEPRKLLPEEIRLIESMSDQIGVAVENINLFEEVKSKSVELEASNSELREALEQQTATSRILGVIASSPTDIDPVLNVVAENAARLCEAIDALIFRVEDNVLRAAAHYGQIPIPSGSETLPVDRDTVCGRAVVDRQMLHIHDVATVPEAELPAGPARRRGTRTMLAMPLLREGTAVGVILIRRDGVRPFSDSQIALLKTFANQAVIAIENVRLFQEVQARNRDLTEALEQQTATSEILGVISSSPTSLDPVFQTILSNITVLCESNIAHVALYDGDSLTIVAQHGTTPEFAQFLQGRRRPSRETPTRLAALELRTIHVTDLLSDPEFSPPSLEIYRRENVRTVLSVPMFRKDRLVGVMTTWRREVKPFTEKQIALV
ncbi:MAG TPA: GAF domain-containing protein, partial [Terriglobales bacterium]|nr:GAF domain-containing protein [Terriglobales bacterium]